MHARRRVFVLAAAAAGLLVAAASAGAQANGAPAPQSGFRIETLLMKLSLFLPEEYARLRIGQDGLGQGGQQAARPGGQGAPQGSAQGGGQGGQRQQRFNLPEFTRDPKLMLTARQVDALLPVLQDLQRTPFPTPSQAKKITATVDATLTKQQKDAYEKYVKEREKAIEELRKQAQSRSGTPPGGTASQSPGAPGAPASPDAPRQGAQGGQRDPAEVRKRMLGAFIRNLQEYRKGLQESSGVTTDGRTERS